MHLVDPVSKAEILSSYKTKPGPKLASGKYVPFTFGFVLKVKATRLIHNWGFQSETYLSCKLSDLDPPPVINSIQTVFEILSPTVLGDIYLPKPYLKCRGSRGEHYVYFTNAKNLCIEEIKVKYHFPGRAKIWPRPQESYSITLTRICFFLLKDLLFATFSIL